MTDTSVEKQGDEVNCVLATEELGQSKRKRIPRQLADALNGCLCGLVLNASSSGALKCKQTGCETQWVSTAIDYVNFIIRLTSCTSIISSASNWSKSHGIGCARLVRHLANASGENDVILLYLEMFLIT